MLPLTRVTAEGNPDEEKIGAFGVGELCLQYKKDIAILILV